MIKSSYKDTYNAILWLRQNRHVFQGHIYEPMLLEVIINQSRFEKKFFIHKMKFSITVECERCRKCKIFRKFC